MLTTLQAVTFREAILPRRTLSIRDQLKCNFCTKRFQEKQHRIRTPPAAVSSYSVCHVCDAGHLSLQAYARDGAMAWVDLPLTTPAAPHCQVQIASREGVS